MTVGQAIHILHMHKNRIHGIGRKPGRWLRPRGLDEMRDSILRKLEALERGSALSEADKARSAREFARRRG